MRKVTGNKTKDREIDKKTGPDPDARGGEGTAASLAEVDERDKDARIAALDESLDAAIDEMLCQLEANEKSPQDEPPSEDSPAHEFQKADTVTRSDTDLELALTPLNAAVREQSQILLGLTQSLQFLQLSVADLQNAPQVPRAVASLQSDGEVSNPQDDEISVSASYPADADGDAETTQEQSWNDIKAALATPQEAQSDSHMEAIEPESLEAPQYESVSQSDLLQMDDTELRALLLDQERVICRLVQTARAQTRGSITLTPEQLRELRADLPEELAKQVRGTLKKLDEQARLGELELSLERARISRQLSHLEDTRQILEGNARALGLEIGPEGRIVGSLKDARVTGSKGRRWLGALGFGD